jgi:Protein kinase domain
MAGARQPGDDANGGVGSGENDQVNDGAQQDPGHFGGFEAADPAAVGWGTAFGSGYLLQREIGVGGMGTVWRGWALGAQHAVAIKILHPHLSGDPGVVGRFLREGDVLKRLDHPNLVKVRDLVVEGGKLGLVMDLVEGGDLHARRKRHGTLPPAEVARIGAQAAAALAAAHALGVAHLDLKPANILIESDDVIDVRLTDFGIARLVDSPDQATTTTTYGTPDYMAPEIGLTGTSGPASDLYALGITLYELVVGRTPHGGGQALAVLARHIERRPKRLPGIPDQLWEVIDACTAREPGDRPEAAAVAEALAAAEPALAGLPALEAVPRATNFQVTSEPRDAEAQSMTIAVPWLAAVAAANRPTQAVNVGAGAGGGADEVHELAAGHDDGTADTGGSRDSGGTDGVADIGSAGGTGSTDATSEDVFAAALLKPPPSGPFSTLPQHPAPGPRVHLPTVSRNTRRRATLIGAPLVLLGVAGISLIASGAFAGTPQSPNSDGRYVVGGPGSAQAGGAGGSSAADGTTAAAKTSASKSASRSKGKQPSASATSPGSIESTAPGGTSTTVGGSTTTTVTTTTTTTSVTTSSPPIAASPSATDTGLVCRSGGFKDLGGFSENPCIQDDNGTLTLEGELKGGSYNTAMVVVVRVDDGGTYSSAHISKSVTPSQLGDHVYVYSVSLGSWPAGENITCEENVDKATTPTDYTYGSNSADIKTTS